MQGVYCIGGMHVRSSETRISTAISKNILKYIWYKNSFVPTVHILFWQDVSFQISWIGAQNLLIIFLYKGYEASFKLCYLLSV